MSQLSMGERPSKRRKISDDNSPKVSSNLFLNSADHKQFLSIFESIGSSGLGTTFNIGQFVCKEIAEYATGWFEICSGKGGCQNEIPLLHEYENKYTHWDSDKLGYARCDREYKYYCSKCEKHWGECHCAGSDYNDPIEDYPVMLCYYPDAGQCAECNFMIFDDCYEHCCSSYGCDNMHKGCKFRLCRRDYEMFSQNYLKSCDGCGGSYCDDCGKIEKEIIFSCNDCHFENILQCNQCHIACPSYKEQSNIYSSINVEERQRYGDGPYVRKCGAKECKAFVCYECGGDCSPIEVDAVADKQLKLDEIMYEFQTKIYENGDENVLFCSQCSKER